MLVDAVLHHQLGNFLGFQRAVDHRESFARRFVDVGGERRGKEEADGRDSKYK